MLNRLISYRTPMDGMATVLNIHLIGVLLQGMIVRVFMGVFLQ